MSKPEKFNLGDTVVSLLQSEPFFAAFSRRIEKRATPAIPTAGVRVNPYTQQFEMLYNPDFFAALSPAHQRGVLMHEFYHIILQHVTDRKPESGLTRLHNIAMDLAINSLPSMEGMLPCEKHPGPVVGESPMKACIPGEGIFKDYPGQQSYEWYLDKLKQDQKEEDSPGGHESAARPLDSHEGFGEADEASSAIAKERLKQTLGAAAKEVNKDGKSWGSISAEMKKRIMAMTKGTIDWRVVLRYFVKTSQRSDRRSTPRKINRRFPKVHPGKRVTRTASIAISIDQSASVDDGMLALFFVELNKLSKIATFTIIPFDCDVAQDKVYIWKRGEKRPWERVLSGGTDFNPPTRYVNERSFDGHIILTDMMAPKPISSRCQRMWMTTEEYAEKPYFVTNERVLAIKRA